MQQSPLTETQPVSVTRETSNLDNLDPARQTQAFQGLSADDSNSRSDQVVIWRSLQGRCKLSGITLF